MIRFDMHALLDMKPKQIKAAIAATDDDNIFYTSLYYKGVQARLDEKPILEPGDKELLKKAQEIEDACLNESQRRGYDGQ